jgi:hypothetical protein
VAGAELHQLKIVGNVIKVEEKSMLTKFDVEDNGNSNGNGNIVLR